MSIPPEVSVVLPVFNEEHNLAPLVEELATALDRTGRPWEIVAVDDGSTDGSFERLRELAGREQRLVVVRLRRNFGQTAAFAAGFDHARGAVVVTMDADLQNDPRDLERCLAEIDAGADIVSGWRVHRTGSFWSRRIPSIVANRLISSATGVSLHDYGCSLKAYRREILGHLELYGELHRFIPAIASQYGATIVELPVNDRVRRHHRSKYGLGRTVRVLFDLLTVRFLLQFGTRPSHFFASLGAVLGLGGAAISAYLAFVRVVLGQPIADRPLLLLGILLIIVGVQLVGLGLVAELVLRAYYSGAGRRPYVVRQVLRSSAHEE